MNAIAKLGLAGLAVALLMQTGTSFAQFADPTSQTQQPQQNTLFHKQDMTPPSLELKDKSQDQAQADTQPKAKYWWYYNFRNSTLACMTEVEASHEYLGRTNRRGTCTDKDRIKHH